MTVAETILAQLGGRKFIAMTGAKNFLGAPNRLTFKIMPNARKVTHVRIELTAGDDYTVEFLAIRGTQPPRSIARAEGVYCDNLAKVFESHTGLATSL